MYEIIGLGMGCLLLSGMSGWSLCMWACWGRIADLVAGIFDLFVAVFFLYSGFVAFASFYA